MCGIVGFITSEDLRGEADRRKFMKQALYVDTMRGNDSTGVFAAGMQPLFEDKTADYLKQIGPGYEFVSSKEYRDRFSTMAGLRAVIGHNRAATMGTVDVDNAHPFAEGPITLVHNGTLISTHGMPSPMHSLGKVTVDSHAITHNLAAHPLKEVIKNLDGAFVLVWHDARDDSINVIRNARRPLHLALDRTGETLYMASEGAMLSFIGSRLSLGLQDIRYPLPGQHLKWLRDTPLDAPVIEELTLHTLSTAQQWRGWGAPSRSANSTPALTEDAQNRIFINGIRKEVPDILQEKLLDHGYFIEDRLTFTPGVAVENSTQGMTVEGMVENTEEGIIYNVSKGTYEKFGDNDWTVRPVGISEAPDGKQLLILYLDAVVPPKKVSAVAVPADHNTLYVRGPEGTHITAVEFTKLVALGCSVCGSIIRPPEADYVEWGVDRRPTCPDCATYGYN